MHITQIGRGDVRAEGESYHLFIPPTDARAYHDAQISTYVSPRDFDHVAPTRLHIRAHATGEIRGTAGFGFWNHPFSPDTRRLRLPAAAWFFYGSPPNDMALAKGVPGHGWKCATIDARNPHFLSLLPVAPMGFLLMRNRRLYNALWPIGQRALNVSEHCIAEHIPTEAHNYTITWQADRVIFEIDGARVHESPFSPRGRLGFIAWVDNQYAVVTPQGRFRFGVVDVPAAQGLHVAVNF